jgi:CheY-like chemotaxis protein
MEQRPKILIVDDKPENIYTLEKILRQLDVAVIQTTKGWKRWP